MYFDNQPTSLQLVDLDLSGGAFYTDGLSEYLQMHGKLLAKLNLVHVEEMDIRSFALITICCPNLIEFGINNCEVIEDDIRGKKKMPYFFSKYVKCV